MSHTLKSKRVAPFNADGDQVHLRSSKEAQESLFHEQLNVSAPFDWSFCVATYDKSKEEWIEIVETFNDFSSADKKFVELSKGKYTDFEIDRLKTAVGRSNPSGPAPKH